jgi:ketosteroid isomerase-like protein
VTTAERFRAAVERKDLAAAGELLADDVVFHSPVTFHPFLGRETVSALFGEVVQVFKDFRYTDELEMDGAHALIFRAGVAGTDREIEGIDLLRFDADGLIADFTVMLRPLSALVPFARAMGERARAADRSKIGQQTTRA